MSGAPRKGLNGKIALRRLTIITTVRRVQQRQLRRSPFRTAPLAQLSLNAHGQPIHDHDTDPRTPRRRCDDVPQPAESASIAQAKASLIVLAGWEIGKEIEVGAASMILGRSVECDTCVNAPSVSRPHAQIDLVEEGGERSFRVTDPGSSNGTHVNNTRTPSARLQNGDKVKMGDVLFKFVLQDEIDARFHQHVHRLIHYDQLTGLLAMDAFRLRLDEALRAARPGVAFCLAMTDLDGLKKVNDTHGHLAGRMVVGAMGRIIRESVRATDYASRRRRRHHPVPRYGPCGGHRGKLRRASSPIPFEYDGKPIRVTISQGLAEFPVHGRTPEALIASADRALYAAKAAGRN